MRFKAVYIFIFCVFISGQFFAQQQDTLTSTATDSTKTKKAVKKAIYSSARKAAIMSAVVPGLGQIYNKKYWKAPVIYVALGGLGYWGFLNHVKYKYYSNNLRAIYDNDESTTNTTFYSETQLIALKNDYKKYRDIAIMAGAFVYILNIIDANVDAHLKTFDVSDDLSLQLKPYSGFDYRSTLQTGVTLKLTFK